MIMKIVNKIINIISYDKINNIWYDFIGARRLGTVSQRA